MKVRMVEVRVKEVRDGGEGGGGEDGGGEGGGDEGCIKGKISSLLFDQFQTPAESLQLCLHQPILAHQSHRVSPANLPPSPGPLPFLITSPLASRNPQRM